MINAMSSPGSTHSPPYGNCGEWVEPGDDFIFSCLHNKNFHCKVNLEDMETEASSVMDVIGPTAHLIMYTTRWLNKALRTAHCHLQQQLSDTHNVMYM